MSRSSSHGYVHHLTPHSSALIAEDVRRQLFTQNITDLNTSPGKYSITLL